MSASTFTVFQFCKKEGDAPTFYYRYKYDNRGEPQERSTIEKVLEEIAEAFDDYRMLDMNLSFEVPGDWKPQGKLLDFEHQRLVGRKFNEHKAACRASYEKYRQERGKELPHDDCF